MRAGAGMWQVGAGLALCATLAACTGSTLAPRESAVSPQARPDVPTQVAAPADAGIPSDASRALAQYYARVQSDLLVRGLLRVDGGGVDTPITDTMVAREFETIALGEEYVRGQGLRRNTGELGRVQKWQTPVRVAAEFGPSVPTEQRKTDLETLTGYVDRLARVTGHPIRMATTQANFYVLFMSEDDSALVQPRVRALVPQIDENSLAIFDNLPRDVHCLVFTFADMPGSYAYGLAISLIRAEHPDLLRKSCIHEEVAQGLGLGNDSPTARPSIFNDDDEFALLTTQDEFLLRILYDARLTPGMTAAEARPIVRALATETVGGPS